MNTVEILKAARELISDEKRWTQGELARDMFGIYADYDSDDAVCFCSEGAIRRVTITVPSDERLRARQDAWGALNKAAGGNIVTFNEGRTHSEVLAVFDRAIACAESEAA